VSPVPFAVGRKPDGDLPLISPLDEEGVLGVEIARDRADGFVYEVDPPLGVLRLLVDLNRGGFPVQAALEVSEFPDDEGDEVVYLLGEEPDGDDDLEGLEEAHVPLLYLPPPLEGRRYDDGAPQRREGAHEHRRHRDAYGGEAPERRDLLPHLQRYAQDGHPPVDAQPREVAHPTGGEPYDGRLRDEDGGDLGGVQAHR